jgi:hypothetical protein
MRLHVQSGRRPSGVTSNDTALLARGEGCDCGLCGRVLLLDVKPAKAGRIIPLHLVIGVTQGKLRSDPIGGSRVGH